MLGSWLDPNFTLPYASLFCVCSSPSPGSHFAIQIFDAVLVSLAFVGLLSSDDVIVISQFRVENVKVFCLFLARYGHLSIYFIFTNQ